MSNTGIVGDWQIGSTVHCATSAVVGHDIIFFHGSVPPALPTAEIDSDLYDRVLYRLHHPGATVPLNNVIAQLDERIAAQE